MTRLPKRDALKFYFVHPEFLDCPLAFYRLSTTVFHFVRSVVYFMLSFFFVYFGFFLDCLGEGEATQAET